MSHLVIKDLTANNASQYKEFFSKGLVSDPLFFRITLNDEQEEPFPTKDKADSFTLGAFMKCELAGVVSFERDGSNREKLRHKGILFRMYVSKDFRGQGLATNLIETLIERVKGTTDVEQINLTVVADNIRAKKLYEKLGFKTFGSEQKALKWNNNYFTEDHMVLDLQ